MAHRGWTVPGVRLQTIAPRHQTTIRYASATAISLEFYSPLDPGTVLAVQLQTGLRGMSCIRTARVTGATSPAFAREAMHHEATTAHAEWVAPRGAAVNGDGAIRLEERKDAQSGYD